MAMQYQGHVIVGGLTIYVTGAQANLARKPIIPEIVWGSGWRVNFATGIFEPTFSIDFPWFTSYASGSPSLLARCINENTSGSGTRNTFFDGLVFNGGIGMSFTNIKCGSISFSANAMSNDALTCKATFLGKDDPAVSRTGGSPTAPTQTLLETPVPAYKMAVNAVIGSTNIPSSAITEFEISVNNNPFVLFTLDGDEVPSDIQLGLMDVTGSYTYYSAGIATAPASKAGGSMTIVGGGLNFSIPNMIYTDDGNDLSGPNGKPLRRMRFTAMGNATTPPVTS